MAETTTDDETIRQWAESKGGKPAAVDRIHQGVDVKKSMFNKIVGRDTAERREHGEHGASRH